MASQEIKGQDGTVLVLGSGPSGELTEWQGPHWRTFADWSAYRGFYQAGDRSGIVARGIDLAKVARHVA
jgi:hypothetical protein